MADRAVLAIDQGPTGSRAVVFDQSGRVGARAYREIRQSYPKPGWVEHDPNEYITSVRGCVEEAVAMCKGEVRIEAVGITNQRETVIAWDAKSGDAICNAIVWQCRRSAPYCEQLIRSDHSDIIRDKTGLIIDAYFSGSKIRWILDHVPEARRLARVGRLMVGCVDSWLMWNLTGGKVHVTDVTNASRTMLFNIHELDWDPELLELLEIPESILPEVKESSAMFGTVAPGWGLPVGTPICGVAGDQQAALFGQACHYPGMVKNTYGTALAAMMNAGNRAPKSNAGLTTDLAWSIDGKPEYALEGVVFIGGAAIQWLRDGLKIIRNAAESESLARRVDSTEGVYFVPAFVGLCAPYWDMYARGAIVGLTRGTTDAHLARAALEAIAYQTKDCIEAMTQDIGEKVPVLRVDGGATRNDFLMQFQADILGIPVERAANMEMAAQGAAYLAGLYAGVWSSKNELGRLWKSDRIFEPNMSADERAERYAGWKKAVERSMDWARP